MIEKIILKKSAVLDKMPAAEQLDYGEIALNYNAAHPFLSFKDSDGDIMPLNDYSQDIAYLFSHKLDVGVLDTINENTDAIKKKLNITDFNTFKEDNTKTINAFAIEVGKALDTKADKTELNAYAKLTDATQTILANKLKADDLILAGFSLNDLLNTANNNISRNTEYISNVELQKVNKTDITQSTGTSETAVMSQKAVSDALSTKLDTINATIAKKADISTLTEYAKKTDIPPEEIFVGNSAAAPSTAKIAIDFDSDILEIQQTTGDSTTNVMSQKAVTDALNSIIARMEKLEKA